MPSQPSAASPPIGDTLGALYIGSIIAAVLFGITNLQVVIYYKKYPNDWWFYRYSVAFLWVLDALHVALSSHALYFYLIDKYGDLVGVLESNDLSMQLQLDVNVVIAVVYAIRLWKLGAHLHKILPWFVLLAVAASLGAGIFVIYDISVVPNLIAVSTIKVWNVESFNGHGGSHRCSHNVLLPTQEQKNYNFLFYGWFNLWFNATGSGFGVNNKVGHLFDPTAQVVHGHNSACSLLTLITFIVLPESLIFLGIHFALSKLYVNSLLAMLNYRREKRAKNPDTERGGQPISAILQFTPYSFERTAGEANISIPLSEIQDTSGLDNKLNSSKGTIDSDALN
ncbi:hypothetical protein IW262DRAFT_1459490 [Armillaria fumosa]|nr:hypothetical protein IW262DRAFT_1459490 [Armillaria fumosa]